MYQPPFGTRAARLRRQAALGYATAPVLRTKPSESLPHGSVREHPAPTRDSDLRSSSPDGEALTL